MEKVRKGFYYHFKHDPKGPVNNYAYEVMGMSKNSETDKISVIYKPLYNNEWLGDEIDFTDRAVDMFMDNVNKPEYLGPRFRLIEDPEIISKLNDISNQSDK